MGISCNNPHGAFYIFVNIKSLGMTSMEVAEYLLDNQRSPWYGFRIRLEGEDT